MSYFALKMRERRAAAKLSGGKCFCGNHGFSMDGAGCFVCDRCKAIESRRELAFANNFKLDKDSTWRMSRATPKFKDFAVRIIEESKRIIINAHGHYELQIGEQQQ
jgi:hypothetical protein